MNCGADPYIEGELVPCEECFYERSLTPDELVLHYPEMRAAARKLKGGREADDLVQETFLRALTNLDKFKPEYVRAWLYTIMRNIYKNDLKWKTNKQFTNMLHELRVPPVYPIDIFDNLPNSLRTVAEMYYITGYTTKEISHLTGFTEGTVCSKLYKARHDKSINDPAYTGSPNASAKQKGVDCTV